MRRTLVQLAPTDAVRRVASPDAALAVHLASRPDAQWIAAFLGEGFDAADGESRSRTLARGTDTVFASLRDGDDRRAGFSTAWRYAYWER